MSYYTTYGRSYGQPSGFDSYREEGNQPYYNRYDTNRRRESYNTDTRRNTTNRRGEPDDNYYDRSDPREDINRWRDPYDTNNWRNTTNRWGEPYNTYGDRRNPSGSYRYVDRNERYDYEDRKDLNIVTLDVLAIDNAFDHHTVKFDAVRRGKLVVRRGQPFDMVFVFNREFDPERDSLRFIFQTGRDPDSNSGTYGICLLGSSRQSSGFKAEIRKRFSKDEILVSVSSSADCIVSNWKMWVETVELLQGRVKSISFSEEISLFILFNPWYPGDKVYFPDQRYLEEYINNDSGVIFQGNYKQIGGKPWFFGQFEDGILETSIYCMQKGLNFKFDSSMGDPVKVSRAISKIVNAQDDNGILVGNWSNDYSGGVSPLKWSGSVSILQEYMETNLPVKFGQCFVYSGIVTTICRAIGIPCRSVTNFASAHDTDGNLTIDVYFDVEKEEILEGETKDSIWNFHVWNDVWMQRDDLHAKFNGWQAIDATPQERSGGYMQLGPVSLNGIKEGFTDLDLDSPFVFAEVNGDRLIWAKENNGRRYVINEDTSAVGKKISTKIPDGRPVPNNLTNVERIRQDITDQYKYAEESRRERAAVKAAKRYAHGRKPYYDETDRQDIVFEGFEDMDNILIGNDFEMVGIIRNTSSERRSVEVKMLCEAVSYTGQRLSLIKQQSFSGMLESRRASKALMFIRYADYAHRVNEQGSMKISLIIRVLDTGRKHVWQDDFRLRRPDLAVEILGYRSRVFQPIDCRVSFINPLPSTALRNCTLTFEGAGFKESQKHMRVADIPPYDRLSEVFTLTPTKSGKRQLFVTFNCDQIEDISGAAELDVD